MNAAYDSGQPSRRKPPMLSDTGSAVMMLGSQQRAPVAFETHFSVFIRRFSASSLSRCGMLRAEPTETPAR